MKIKDARSVNDWISTNERLPERGRDECTRCISCKYAVRNKEGELNPRDIVCSMWRSDGFEAGDYCSRGEEGTYAPDDNCIQDQEGYEVI